MRWLQGGLLLLSVLWLAGCGDDDPAVATALPQSTRDQWQIVCECDPEAWVCELVDDDAVFACMEDVIAEHEDEQRSKLACYARESRRFASCYRAHRCNDAKVEDCIGGDDDLSEFCGELPAELDAEIGACLGQPGDGGAP